MHHPRWLALTGLATALIIGFGATTEFLLSTPSASTTISAPVSICPELKAGDRFKVAGFSAVYLLNDNRKRLYFPSSEVYHTWFENFSDITEMAPACIDDYDLPDRPPYGVNYRSGSRLVKLKVSPHVYAIAPGNRLAKLGSEEVAEQLYGADWRKLVRDLSDEFWPNFVAEDPPIVEAKPHEGMIVTAPDEATNYYVQNGRLRPLEGSLLDLTGIRIHTLPPTVFAALERSSSILAAREIPGDPAQAAIFTFASTASTTLITAPPSPTTTLPASPTAASTSTSATSTAVTAPPVLVTTPPATVPANPTAPPATSSATTTSATPTITATSTPSTNTTTTLPVSTTSSLPTTPITTMTTTTTAPNPPVPAPVITSIQATNTDSANTQQITWTTDRLSDSTVVYGTTSGVYTGSASTDCSGSMSVTSHCVNLSNLNWGMIYYYIVKSKNAGSETASAEKQFSVPSGTPPPPVLSPITSTSSPIHLQWSSNVNVDKYQLFRQTAPFVSGYSDQIGLNLPGGYTGTFTDPVSPGTYQYTVSACKPVCSAPSNYQAVTIN